MYVCRQVSAEQGRHRPEDLKENDRYDWLSNPELRSRFHGGHGGNLKTMRISQILIDKYMEERRQLLHGGARIHHHHHQCHRYSNNAGLKICDAHQRFIRFDWSIDEYADRRRKREQQRTPRRRKQICKRLRMVWLTKASQVNQRMEKIIIIKTKTKIKKHIKDEEQRLALQWWRRGIGH